MRICPKCKIEMKVYFTVGGRVLEWECPKCGRIDVAKWELENIKKARDECKEGRTYLMCCGTKTKRITARCEKSGERLWICPTHHFKECDKWYKLGRKDERKKLKVKI